MASTEPPTAQLAAASLESAGAPPAVAAAGAEQKVTPWDVEGATVDGQQVAIDYDKLLVQFGTRKIDAPLLERFEKVTGWRPHPLLRRGAFFSHR